MSGRRTLKLLLILTIVASVSVQASLRNRVSKKLTGGTIITANYSQWELHRFKDTELHTVKPFCYCPWLSYVVINHNVFVEEIGNKNALRIANNIKKLVQNDAKYNREFCRNFKVTGTVRQKVRKIFKYCKNTVYTAHVKTAKDVFQKRKGDCAGISAAFYVLCICNKISVKYVIGWTETGCHAWNRVKIGSKWYWIDCTFGYYLSEKQYKHRHVMEIW